MLPILHYIFRLPHDAKYSNSFFDQKKYQIIINKILWKTKKNNTLLIIILVIILILMTGYFVFTNNQDETKNNSINNNNAVTTNESAVNTNPIDNETLTTNTVNTDTPTSENIIPLNKFTVADTNWFEYVWYKTADSSGEVTYSSNGVTFTGLKSNSRSGIIKNLEVDISDYTKLNLHLIATNSQQTLTGTG